jgi:hypothetical protein
MRGAHLLVRRLRVRPRQPGSRAASGPDLGALRPLREELAAWGCAGAHLRKRGPQPKNAAAERRKARRSASWAGDLRRSGDRPVREAGHRVRRFRTSACRRSAPLIFFGERKKDKGLPAPCQNRAAEHWLVIPGERATRARFGIHNPDRFNVARSTNSSSCRGYGFRARRFAAPRNDYPTPPQTPYPSHRRAAPPDARRAAPRRRKIPGAPAPS